MCAGSSKQLSKSFVLRNSSARVIGRCCTKFKSGCLWLKCSEKFEFLCIFIQSASFKIFILYVVVQLSYRSVRFLFLAKLN